MDLYSLIKTAHIISSTILFGTGIGIAFFMLQSFFTDKIKEKFYAAKSTVLADGSRHPATGIPQAARFQLGA